MRPSLNFHKKQDNNILINTHSADDLPQDEDINENGTPTVQMIESKKLKNKNSQIMSVRSEFEDVWD